MTGAKVTISRTLIMEITCTKSSSVSGNKHKYFYNFLSYLSSVSKLQHCLGLFPEGVFKNDDGMLAGSILKIYENIFLLCSVPEGLGFLP